MVATVQSGVHLGDEGTAFIIEFLQDNVAMDISTSTAVEIRFRTPSGVALPQTGVLVTDGTDGLAQYIAIAGFIDEVGVWEIQGKVTLPGGVWYSAIGYFEVSKNI